MHCALEFLDQAALRRNVAGERSVTSVSIVPLRVARCHGAVLVRSFRFLGAIIATLFERYLDHC